MSEKNVSNPEVTKVEKPEAEAETEKQPCTIYLEKPLDFVVHTEGQITTTVNITRMINNTLSVLFNDYVGCHVYVYTGGFMNTLDQWLTSNMHVGYLYTDLFFEKNNSSGGGIDNIDFVNRSANNDLQRLRRATNTFTSRLYELTEDTKEALTELMPGYVEKMKNPDRVCMWDRRVVETTTPMAPYNNQPKVTLEVRALDVDAIIGKLFGTKVIDQELAKKDKIKATKEAKVKYDYHCMPLTRALSGYNAYNYAYQNANLYTQPDYVVQILRNNRSIIAATQEAMGINNYNTQGFVPAR